MFYLLNLLVYMFNFIFMGQIDVEDSHQIRGDYDNNMHMTRKNAQWTNKR